MTEERWLDSAHRPDQSSTRPMASLYCAAAFVLGATLCLSFPLKLPIGAFYWDVAVYSDAFHRIGLGQAPALDFFAPVGPLGYYAGFLLDRLFPIAHPLFIANWALLPVVLPLALVVIWQRGARDHALGLLLPFLVLVALPINLSIFYPGPGLDGFGAYNRHAAALLYWLIATLIFVQSARGRTVLVAVFMLALFLTKITGAAVGAILVGYACLAGRLRVMEAGAAALACIAALALLDLPMGLIRAYVGDILTLLRLNSETLLPRLLTVASANFGIVLPASALIGLLLWAEWRSDEGNAWERLRRVVAGPAGWLAAVMAALAVFETQNTGSLEFIGLWPVLYLLLTQWRRQARPFGPVVVVLALAVVLPSLMQSLQRGARALAGMAGDVVALPAPEVGPLGRVSLKRGLAERAELMLQLYPRHAATFAGYADRGLEPSSLFYAEPDNQATWLLEVRQGLLALRDWEAREQRRLNGVFTLDFVEPFNALLGRGPVHGVPLGITPGRNLPPLDERVLASLAATDAILVPKCPLTPARLTLASHYAPALVGRRPVALAPCWDMYVTAR